MGGNPPGLVSEEVLDRRWWFAAGKLRNIPELEAFVGNGLRFPRDRRQLEGRTVYRLQPSLKAFCSIWGKHFWAAAAPASQAAPTLLVRFVSQTADL